MNPRTFPFNVHPFQSPSPFSKFKVSRFGDLNMREDSTMVKNPDFPLVVAHSMCCFTLLSFSLLSAHAHVIFIPLPAIVLMINAISTLSLHRLSTSQLLANDFYLCLLFEYQSNYYLSFIK